MAKEYLTQESGKRLKTIIDQLNLSGSEMAKVCGYATSYIYFIINGTRRLPRSVAEKVSAAYGINMEWIETGDGKMLNAERWSDKGIAEQETPGKRLRTVCENSGLSQRDFCEKLKCSTSTFQQFLFDRKIMTLNFAKRIEAEFDVGADWLLYGNKKSKEYPCSDKMIIFLKENPDKREIVWMWMQENGGQN